MSSVLNCVACALALTVSEAPLGQALDTTLVSEGARVKVFPASGATAPVIGTVVDLALDTLVVLTELHSMPVRIAPHEPGSVTVAPRLSCPAMRAGAPVSSRLTRASLSAFVDRSGRIVIHGQQSPRRWVPELCLRTDWNRTTLH